MENIIEPTSDFNFNKLNLESPSPLHNGTFFTKISYTDKKLPLYIQLPKCKSKNGIVKNSSSKKSYIDLLFNYYETELLSWFENLENRCTELIHNKKDTWFQTDITLDDIESLFISSTKSYKSGKFITIRAYIPSSKQIKQEYCMIYDEKERSLDTTAVKDSVELIPLACIDGIKFSSKSFQLDITIPQIMVMNMQNEIKNECMIKSTTFNKKNNNLEETTILEDSLNLEDSLINSLEASETNLDKVNNDTTLDKVNNDTTLDKVNNDTTLEKVEKEKHLEKVKKIEKDKPLEKVEKDKPLEKVEKDIILESDKTLEKVEELKEIDLHVMNNINDEISLKSQDDIYHEIYKSAKNKAKHMKQAAIEAYLEAKNIRTKYMLEELVSSDDENDSFYGN
jgi:hypothetical protein